MKIFRWQRYSKTETWKRDFFLDGSFYMKMKNSWCISTSFRKQACFSTSRIEVPMYICAQGRTCTNNCSLSKWCWSSKYLEVAVSAVKPYKFSPELPINSTVPLPVWTRRIWHFVCCQKWIQLVLRTSNATPFDLMENVPAYGRGLEWDDL